MTATFLPLSQRAIAEARWLFGCDIAGRTAEAVEAKRAVVLALDGYGWTAPRIARAMSLDRSTVLYHLDAARTVAKSDRFFASAAAQILAHLREQAAL